jgi:hypothetical protein
LLIELGILFDVIQRVQLWRQRDMKESLIAKARILKRENVIDEGETQRKTSAQLEQQIMSCVTSPRGVYMRCERWRVEELKSLSREREADEDSLPHSGSAVIQPSWQYQAGIARIDID